MFEEAVPPVDVGRTRDQWAGSFTPAPGGRNRDLERREYLDATLSWQDPWTSSEAASQDRRFRARRMYSPRREPWTQIGQAARQPLPPYGVARFVGEGDKSFHINKLDMVEAPGVGLCLVNGATPLT
jgi:hypothetical protein